MFFLISPESGAILSVLSVFGSQRGRQLPWHRDASRLIKFRTPDYGPLVQLSPSQLKDRRHLLGRLLDPPAQALADWVCLYDGLIWFMRAEFTVQRE